MLLITKINSQIVSSIALGTDPLNGSDFTASQGSGEAIRCPVRIADQDFNLPGVTLTMYSSLTSSSTKYFTMISCDVAPHKLYCMQFKSTQQLKPKADSVIGFDIDTEREVMVVTIDGEIMPVSQAGVNLYAFDAKAASAKKVEMQDAGYYDLALELAQNISLSLNVFAKTVDSTQIGSNGSLAYRSIGAYLPDHGSESNIIKVPRLTINGSKLARFNLFGDVSLDVTGQTKTSKLEVDVDVFTKLEEAVDRAVEHVTELSSEMTDMFGKKVNI